MPALRFRLPQEEDQPAFEPLKVDLPQTFGEAVGLGPTTIPSGPQPTRESTLADFMPEARRYVPDPTPGEQIVAGLFGHWPQINQQARQEQAQIALGLMQRDLQAKQAAALQQHQQRLEDIRLGGEFLSGLTNITERMAPQYRKPALKIMFKKFGMPEDYAPEIMDMFQKAAEDTNLDLGGAIQKWRAGALTMSQIKDMFSNPDQGFAALQRTFEQQQREKAATAVEQGPGKATPGEAQAAAIRAGMGATEQAAVRSAVTPEPTQAEQLAALPPTIGGQARSKVNITKDKFGMTKVTAEYGGEKQDITNDFDAYAMKNFGKRYSQLSGPEMAQTLREIEDKSSRIAAARATGELSLLGGPEATKEIVDTAAKDIVSGTRSPESVRTQLGRLNAILGPQILRRVQELGGMPVPLTQGGQKVLASIDPVQQQTRELMKALEPFKGNNMPGYFATSYAQYRMGLLPPNDPQSLFLHNADLALNSIQGITPFMRGMRNMQWVERIERHLPRILLDSPANMYNKLQTMEENYQRIKDAVYKYERKSGVAQEAPTEWQSSTPSGGPRILKIEKVQ